MNQIDHDPDENPKVAEARGRQLIFLVAFGSVFAAGYFTNEDLRRAADWRDFAAVVCFVVLTYWIVGPLRADRANGSKLGEETSNGLAFRLGKALKRVFRGLSGGA